MILLALLGGSVVYWFKFRNKDKYGATWSTGVTRGGAAGYNFALLRNGADTGGTGSPVKIVKGLATTVGADGRTPYYYNNSTWLQS